MTAAWPSINTYARRGSYSETPDENVSRFSPEVGPAKLRRRMSMSTDTIAFDIWFTTSEYATFLTFWRDTLKDGTLPFTRTRPRTGSTETFVFTQPPKMTNVGYNLWQVSVSLRNVP